MRTLLLACLASAALAAPSFAQSAGDMTLGFGVGYVSPKDGNGTVAGAEVDIDGNARPIITFEYFFRDNVGVEVLGALPFKHDINLGGTKIGTTKHLPPTVSINWHIPTGGPLTPFVGVGLNYTTFFEDRSPLGDLEIDDSFGLAATLGLDYAVSEKGAVRFDLRYIDIDSDVKLDGVKVGEVEVDPLVASISYVWKF
ncbi:MAG: OmpW family outer membrane protein [Gemmobacter sp.]